MQPSLCGWLLIVLVFLSSTAAGGTEQISVEDTGVIDTVVLIVNETSITLGEVRDLALLLKRARVEVPPETTYLDMALKTIIKRRLIVDEAKKIGIIVTDREIEQTIEKEINNRNLDDLNSLLDMAGMDRNTYSERIKDELLYRRAVEAKVTPRIHISPKEITEHYKENISNYQHPAEVDLHGITFFKKADPEKNQKVLETAEQVLKELKDGADFAEMAQQFSEDTERAGKGGEWGWVDREGNVAAKDAFDLPINSVSDIIETSNSYWIVKVTGKKEARTIPLEQEWNKINDDLRLIKRNRLLEQWVEELNKKARIINPHTVKE